MNMNEKYFLYQLLDENGFETTDDNLNTLVENLNSGNTIILGYNPNLMLTEGISKDYFFMRVLDENGFVVSNHNLHVLKEAVKNGSVLLTEDDVESAEYMIKKHISDLDNQYNNVLKGNDRKNQPRSAANHNDADEDRRKDLNDIMAEKKQYEKQLRDLKSGEDSKKQYEKTRKIKKAIHIGSAAAAIAGGTAALIGHGMSGSGKFSLNNNVKNANSAAEDAAKAVESNKAANDELLAKKDSAQKAYDAAKTVLDVNSAANGMTKADYDAELSKLNTTYADKDIDADKINANNAADQKYVDDLNKKAANTSKKQKFLWNGGRIAAGLGLGGAAATSATRMKTKKDDED